jgi:hypothetical protein
LWRPSKRATSHWFKIYKRWFHPRRLGLASKVFSTLGNLCSFRFYELKIADWTVFFACIKSGCQTSSWLYYKLFWLFLSNRLLDFADQKQAVPGVPYHFAYAPRGSKINSVQYISQILFIIFFFTLLC